MINIEIPGFGPVIIEHLVSDYSGTLSVDGILLPDIKDRINRLAENLTIHILTADTHGKAAEQLKNVNCKVILLNPGYQDIQKEDYVKILQPQSVISIGNGANDRRMLKVARIGIAVCLDEGCASETIANSDVMVNSAGDALDLLLKPDRLKATLRF